MISKPSQARDQPSTGEPSAVLGAENDPFPYPERSYIDVQDSHQIWRVGLILEYSTATQTYRIRIQDSKQDEMIPANSPRLAPFRSNTKCTASAIRTLISKPAHKFNMADHNKRLEEIRRFLESPLSNYTSFQFVQLIKGSHFIYTDILTNYALPDIQALRAVLKYFECHLAITNRYMNDYDVTFQRYRAYLDREDRFPSIELEYAGAFSEIFEPATVILGSRPNFVRQNKLLIQQHLDLKSSAHQNDMETCIRLLFSANFYKNGGIDSFDKLMKGISEQEVYIPFEFLSCSLCLYNVLDKTLGSDIRQKCRVGTLIQVVRRNIDRMKDDDLKHTDRDRITQVIQRLQTAAENSFHVRNYLLQCDNIMLALMHRYLLSPVFQAKKDACDSLNEFLARTIDNTNPSNRKHIHEITPHHFLDWLRNRKVMEYLLGESAHAEIFKRGTDLLRLLCRGRLLTEDILELLWNSRRGRHEDFVRLIHHTIVSIAEDPALSPTLLDFLFKKVESVPAKDWDEDYLTLVTEFTIRVITKNFKSFRSNNIFQIYQYYVQNKCSKALAALTCILSRPEIAQVAKKLFMKCLHSIETNDCAMEHIRLLKAIAAVPIQRTQGDPIPTVLKDIKRNAADSASLSDRLDLLRRLLEVFPTIRLTKEGFKEIWDITIQYPASFEVLLKHLIDDSKPLTNRPKQCRESMFSKEVRSYILFDLIKTLTESEESCSRLNPFVFDTFQVYFKQANHDTRALEVFRQSNKYIVNDASALVGLDLLWNFFLKTQETLSQRALEFLIELHTKISVKSDSRKDQFVRQLISQTMNCIHQEVSNSNPNNLVVSRCLDLLRKLIDRIEKRNIDSRKEEADRKFRSDIYRPAQHHAPHAPEESARKKSDNISTPPLPPSLPPALGVIENIAKKEITKELELLLSLLQSDSAARAWKIVNLLPTSASCEQLLERLDCPFEQVFSRNIYYRLYLLQIIQRRKTLPTEWWKRFVECGGVRVLFRDLQLPMKSQVEEFYALMLTSVLIKYYMQPVRCTETADDVCKSFLQLLQRYIQYLAEHFSQRNSIEWDHEKKLVNNIFNVVGHYRRNVEFLEHPALFDMLRTVVVYSNNVPLKKLFWSELQKDVREFKEGDQAKKVVLFFIRELFEEVVRVRPPLAQHYFTLTYSLLDLPEKAITNQMVLPHLPSIFLRLAEVLHSEAAESTSEEYNHILSGCFNLLTILVEDYAKRLPEEVLLELFKYILEECLFKFRSESGGSKCKSEHTRNSAFKLIATMLIRLPHCIPIFYIMGLTVLKTGYWRTRRSTDWNITNKVSEKSQTGYVGIENPGCICYMTSFFQQMYMIPSLRQAIFEAEDPRYSPATEHNNLLYQLKTMFATLQHSEEEYVDPRSFCEAFKDLEGNPVNIFEQMDVDEFTNILFDRLENQTKGARNFINQHFGGVIANEIICRGCPHSSEKQEPFLSISLEVKNKRHIYQSLEALVKGELLEGENAYECDICKKKVAATKRVSLKKLPNHLIIVLKRLEFNYDSMLKIKINDFCEFPMRLDLRPYSQQHLHTVAGKNTELLDQLPDDYYQYELKGTVIHMGFADAGHYYSLIKERTGEQNWFEFNDNVVRPFSVERLAEEAFGVDTHSDVGRSDRRRNSYILIYDRSHFYNQQNVRMQPQPRQPVYRHCERALMEIKHQNENLNQRRIMFAKSMLDFFQDLLKQVPTAETLTVQQHSIFKMCLAFYFSVVVRQADCAQLMENAIELFNRIAVCGVLARETLELFCQPATLRELLLVNPNTDRRKLIANMLVEVYQVASKLVDAASFEHLREVLLTSLLYVVTEKKAMLGENTNELYMMLFKLARFDQRICQLLLQREAIGRCIEAGFHNELRTYPQLTLMDLPDPNEDILHCARIFEESDLQQSQVPQQRKPTLEHHTYLWALLSELLKHCDLGKPSIKRAPGSLGYQPSTKEMTLLLFRGIKSFSEQVVTKLSLRKMSDVLAATATDDLEQTKYLLKWIISEIKNQAQAKFRVCYALYKRLVQIQDSFIEVRMKALEDIVKLTAEEKYFDETEISSQYILKIVRKNTDLLDFLKGSKICRDMIKLTRSHQGSMDVTSSRNELNKVHALHGVKAPRSGNNFITICERRQHEWESIGLGEPISKEEWDSDDDLAQENDLEIERVISYYNQCLGGFYPATVKNLQFDSLTLICDDKPIVLWKDNELLTQQNVPENSESTESDNVESSYEDADDGATSAE